MLFMGTGGIAKKPMFEKLPMGRRESGRRRQGGGTHGETDLRMRGRAKNRAIGEEINVGILRPAFVCGAPPREN
jgi:hypothetical protein